MKYLYSLVGCIIFIQTHLYAQSIKKQLKDSLKNVPNHKLWGIKITGEYYGDDGIYLCPLLVWNYNNHSFSAGPVISLWDVNKTVNGKHYNRSYLALSGIQLGDNYLLRPPDKIVNVFLEYNIKYNYYKRETVYDFFDPFTNSTETLSKKHQSKQLINGFMPGVRINIGINYILYIEIGMGIEFEYYKSNTNTITTIKDSNGTNVFNSTKTGEGTYFTGAGKIGIGYNFR